MRSLVLRDERLLDNLARWIGVRPVRQRHVLTCRRARGRAARHSTAAGDCTTARDCIAATCSDRGNRSVGTWRRSPASGRRGCSGLRRRATRSCQQCGCHGAGHGASDPFAGRNHRVPPRDVRRARALPEYDSHNEASTRGSCQVLQSKYFDTLVSVAHRAGPRGQAKLVRERAYALRAPGTSLSGTGVGRSQLLRTATLA